MPVLISVAQGGLMDAKTVAAAAGIQITTLNAWVHRGYVPGAAPGTRGRARDFDLDTAVHIGLMAELVRLRLGASSATSHAANRDNCKRLLLTHDALPDFDDPNVRVRDAEALARLREDLR